MENKLNKTPSTSKQLILLDNIKTKPNNMPSTSTQLPRLDRKRKIDNQKDTDNSKIDNQQNTENLKPEVGKVNESSIDEIKKLDIVLDYSKKSRLEYNFWDDLQNPTKNADVNDLVIKDLRIGNYIGKRLKLRIVFKSNLRPSRSGFVLNVHGMDQNGSEICMVNFGKDSIGINEQLKVNLVYMLENFTVEHENVAYPSGTGNVLQIKLNSKTTFQELNSDITFPELKFNFVTATSIQALSYNDKVDIIGILVKDHGEEKNYRNSSYRDLAITDESKGTAYVTLWGTDAKNFDCKLFSVILIRKGSISMVEGINKINVLYGTLLWCKPQIPEAIQLEKWFNEEQAQFNNTN